MASGKGPGSSVGGGLPGRPGPGRRPARGRDDGDPVVIMAAGRDPLELSSGDTRYAILHALAARRAGFQPHLFCVSGAVGRAEAVETGFGVVHRLPGGPGLPRFTMLPVHTARIAPAVLRFLAGHPGPGLLHGFGVWAHTVLPVVRRLRRRGTPMGFVVSAYNTMAHESAAKLGGLRPVHGWPERLRQRLEHAWVRTAITALERRSLRAATVVTVNYESVRDLLIRAHGPHLPIRRMPYAPWPADQPVPGAGQPIPPAGLLDRLEPGGAPLVVSLSRHDPRKGVDVLIRALAALRAAGLPLRACLLSGGRLLEAHRRLAARLGLDGSTVLPGWVADPRPYLRAADIFVLPSLEEASGSLALLEAMALGRAIVASAVDGVPEDVTDGESALLVPPGGVDALAGALRRLAGSPGLRATLGRRARDVAIRRFSFPAFAESLGTLYADLGLPGAPR